MPPRLIGAVLCVTLLGVAVWILYTSSSQSRVPLVFSASQILHATWQDYKRTYLEAGTSRTLDPTRDYITTSEGQSYSMLRSVWLADQETFDASWKWAKDNLQHRNGDHLFSWLFGKNSAGAYGVLTERGGHNSASDADTDIALSLLFAYGRWQDHRYLGDARVIMTDIWNKEVITIAGVPYLLSDNTQKSNRSIAIINPSYLNPAAYHLFAKFDNAHPWDALASSSYEILARSTSLSLDVSQSDGLPPDWIGINTQTGALSVLASPPHSTGFGFEALRIPWRLALDWEWFGEPRAKEVLSHFSFLRDEWKAHRKLARIYGHDGTPLDSVESSAIYGGTLGYFLVAEPALATEIYQSKLAPLYDPGTSTWQPKLSYYDDNWVWFGIALYSHALPDLTRDLPVSAFRQ